MKFGEYLKTQRETRAWTQPVAAEKIGIEQSYLSKLETGKASPSEETFERLATAYEMDLDGLASTLDLGELERLRDIAAIRDLIRRSRQSTARGRRRWLVAGLLLLAVGGGLLALVMTEQRYPASEWRYVSKGVIVEGENDFLYGTILKLDSGYITSRHEGDPLVERLDPVYRSLSEPRGEYFVEMVQDGRRVFELDRRQFQSPRFESHLARALAVAMILAGLGGLFVARRW